MPDDQGAAIVRQAVEDAAERGAEPLRVLGDEFRISLAQSLERATSRLLVRGAPASSTGDRRPDSTTTPAGTCWSSAARKQAIVYVARCAPDETARS